jgi:EAL domain-containing protein (putative c-di-GMP-specific phosphodiesterase class I)
LGCEYGQGYYFSTSMAPDLLPSWAGATTPLALASSSPRGAIDALLH